MCKIKSVIVTFIICCLPLTASTAKISEDIQNNYSDLVVRIIEKIAELDKAIDSCVKSNEISDNALKQCQLDKTAVDGLFYINLLAENKCTKDIQLEVLTLLVQERNYRKHHNITPKNWDGMKKEVIDYFNAYLASLPITSDQSVDFKYMFLSIPEQQQTNLLNCKALTKPFYLLDIADSLTKK